MNNDQEVELPILSQAPSNLALIDFPLKPETYQHLPPQFLQYIGAFLYSQYDNENTLRLYHAGLERFLVFLKVKAVNLDNLKIALNSVLIRHYQQSLQNPDDALKDNPWASFNDISNETVDLYLSPVRRLMDYLVKVGVLDHDPASIVRRVGMKNKAELGVPKWFNDQQWEAIIETLKNLPEHTPKKKQRKVQMNFSIMFAYAMGLRVNEQISHTQSNILHDGNRWYLNIVGKGNRARQLGLTTLDNTALNALEIYRREQHLPMLTTELALEPIPLMPAAIIHTEAPNKALSAQAADKQFKGFLKKDVLPKFYQTEDIDHYYETRWPKSRHALRHTRATHAAQTQTPLWLKKFLGHEHLDTSSVYYHIET